MDLRKTITELQQERARLDRVIASLEQLAETGSSDIVALHRRGRRFMSQQERLIVSERMRRYWAGRKAVHEEAPRVMTSASAA
jgi:hypothetical protein